jgi:hypothetical protein
MTTIVDTKIIDDFLTEEEVAALNAEFVNTEKQRPILAYNHKGDLYTKTFGLSKFDPWYTNIIRPKLDLHFGKDLEIFDPHILNSHYPYGMHTDGLNSGSDNVVRYASWTFVIPLDDYDSYTILFNEYDTITKFVDQYVKNNPTAKIQNQLSNEFLEKHLSHEDPELMKYFSLEKMYKWKKCSCFAASRYKFHGSDFYLKNGVTMKRGIIMWGTLPII